VSFVYNMEFNNSNTQCDNMQIHSATTPHTLFFLNINEGIIFTQECSFLLGLLDLCDPHFYLFNPTHSLTSDSYKTYNIS
jgi:hypothetical protein